MNKHDRIEDLQLRIDAAIQEGNFKQANALELEIRSLRSNHQGIQDQNEPYSLEGRQFMDDADH